ESEGEREHDGDHDARIHDRTSAFELVLLLYLHLAADKRRQLLGRAACALAPGGTLLVVGHHSANLATGAPGPRNPDLLYTPSEIAAELPGLTIERAERLVRPVASEEGPVEAIDALVRAEASPA
ncbi:MAG TPA: hypothetical protein VFJ24_12005, partial [Gaiellales bacterium]|nr:hypothetical protein [Gaiellales bacterium]